MARVKPEPAVARRDGEDRSPHLEPADRQAELEAENAALRAALAQQQEALDRLHARHDMLDLMLDAVPVALAYGDVDFNLAHANRKMATWWGHSKQDVVGRNLRAVMLPGGFDEALPFLQKALDTRQTVSHERTVIGRDGQVHVLRQTYSPQIDEDGVVRGIAGVMSDVTEEKRAEEAARDSMRHAAILEERARLAHELHDAATQTIYSAMLIAEALPQAYNRNPEEGQRNLAKLRQLVRGALAELRTLLFELRPWTLEAVELDRLLEYLRHSLTGRVRVNLEWDVQGDCELPAATKTAVYRIVQEAFNNIVKHARASLVRVTLRCEPGGGTLTVADDGRGFEPAGVPGDRMGLQIMRERAQRIGGHVDVFSAQGSGTTVTFTWPVPRAESNEERSDA